MIATSSGPACRERVVVDSPFDVPDGGCSWTVMAQMLSRLEEDLYLENEALDAPLRLFCQVLACEGDVGTR